MFVGFDFVLNAMRSRYRVLNQKVTCCDSESKNHSSHCVGVGSTEAGVRVGSWVEDVAVRIVRGMVPWGSWEEGTK